MTRLTLWTACVVSLLSLIATAWWRWNVSDFEPTAALWVSIFVFSGASIGLVAHYLIGEASPEEKTAAREKKRKDLDWALDRIRGEMKNFMHIQQGKGYSGDKHRRTVEEYSVELLEEEITKLVERDLNALGGPAQP
jgi:hypothetical protein